VTVRGQGWADFRSDTVTKPTPQMRKAMGKAEVGDDVFREDPTVDELEREVAKMLGHEAALFVPSRTMGNLISIMIWCSARGSSFICGEKSHVFLCEEGGAAQFGGVSPFPVPNEADGSLGLESIRQAILEEKDASLAQLITLEDPVDRCGGRVLPVPYVEAVAALAREHGIKLHMDGSRLWNAAAAAGVDVRDIARHADSVTVCISKGLGAPAGSLLVGSRPFVEKARKMRKALGGAMRQVGVLAAAGLVALKRQLPRLQEDHENAKRLASGLGALPGLRVNVAAVETNIVMVDLDERLPLSPQELLEELEKRGVLALAVGPRRLRFVTHYDVGEGGVKKAVAAFDKILLPFREALAPPAAAAQEAAAPAGAAGAAAGASSAAATAPAEEAGAAAASAAGAAAAAAARFAMDGPPPAVIDTTATTVVNNTAAAAAGTTAAVAAGAGGEEAQAEAVEELEVVGVSTSELGFVVVLAQPPAAAGEQPQQVGARKALKVVITPSDPMSAGLDVHTAETPEAVTLLQLLQDIDVGSYLKHDALAGLVGLRAGSPGVTLKRCVIQQLSKDSKRFRARLEVEVPDMHPADATAAVAEEDVQQSQQQSQQQQEGEPPLASAAPAAPTRIVEAEVKSPFQAMALAFRYKARLAAGASVLADAAVAPDLAAVRALFPELLELRPGGVGMGKAGGGVGGVGGGGNPAAVAFDLDAEYEIGRLEKQLQQALEEGNEAAIAKLRKQLALYAPEGGPAAAADLSVPLLQQPATVQQQPPPQQPAQPQPAAPSFYEQAAAGVAPGRVNGATGAPNGGNGRPRAARSVSPPSIPPPVDLIDS
jgi:threonine aldolase